MFACFGCASDGEQLDLPRDQLKEQYERSIQLNEGRLIVTGIFARADKKNNNSRIYPKVGTLAVDAACMHGGLTACILSIRAH